MQNERKLIIAIDGFASSGKSTLAKALADALGYVFIDTGAMYRGVAYFVSKYGLYAADSIHEEALIQRLDEINLLFGAPNTGNDRPLLLNGVDISEEIRSSEISALVSLVAIIPEVRNKLVDLQRQMGQHGGIVMDGRDIGTVVFPQADLKIFVTADIDIRAQRRHIEMRKSSPEITLASVKSNLASRDEIDTKRTTSPLKQAEDAVLFDTGLLTRETQLEKALALVHELLAK
ncbi:MAG: (d)CMP kinase [Cryomorphaceae bacterium]|jgi:cytidylate kinase|nr:(d)CMP kinase [Cryomorphaceae bacterium]